MALLTTIEEVYKYVKLALNTDFDNFQDDFATLEQDVIFKHLEKDQYDELVAAYEGDNLNFAQAELLAHCQRVIVYLGLAEAVDMLDVTISEAGIHRIETDQNKTAYHYQKLDAQRYLARKGHTGLENMLTFLEANKDTYPLWRDSVAYTIGKDLLVSSATQFQQFYNINYSRMLYTMLRPLMKRIQDFRIVPVIGQDFFQVLMDKIKSSNPNWKTEEVVLLDAYLRPGLVHLTVAEAVQELPVQMGENGLTVKTLMATGGGAQQEAPAEDSRLELIKSNAEGVGSKYLADGVLYLNAHASATVFPTFYNSELYAQPGKVEPPKGKKIYNAF